MQHISLSMHKKGGGGEIAKNGGKYLISDIRRILQCNFAKKELYIKLNKGVANIYGGI